MIWTSLRDAEFLAFSNKYTDTLLQRIYGCTPFLITKWMNVLCFVSVYFVHLLYNSFFVIAELVSDIVIIMNMLII